MLARSIWDIITPTVLLSDISCMHCSLYTPRTTLCEQTAKFIDAPTVNVHFLSFECLVSNGF